MTDQTVPQVESSVPTPVTVLSEHRKPAPTERYPLPYGKALNAAGANATSVQAMLINRATRVLDPRVLDIEKWWRLSSGIFCTQVNECTPAGLFWLLTYLGIEIQYDVRACRVELRDNGGPWRRLSDGRRQTLRARVGEAIDELMPGKTERQRALWGNDRFKNWLLAIADSSQIDPFVSWLLTLPEWDKQHRPWLHNLFGCSGNLAEWAEFAIPACAIWRAIQPGYRHKQVPVLVGPQKIGKSPALAHLLPSQSRDKWFTDGLDLARPHKERVEALLGKVIVEVSEMAGATRTELNSLKSFLSATNDNGIRLAYRHDPIDLPRRCVLVGTSNEDAPLPNDITGNSRFVVVECQHGCDVESYMSDNRNQIFAEALFRVLADGEHSGLPRSLHGRQDEVNETYRFADVAMADRIADIACPPGFEEDGWTLHEIARRVGMVGQHDDRPITRTDSMRLAKELQAHGWRKGARRREAGARVYPWYRPGACR